MNPAQLSAVQADPGRPLLVLAGPGTGKTRTLVARIVYLLRNQSAPHALATGDTAGKHFGILALTFSKAAAINMQARLYAALTISEFARVTIKTFHALCLQLCRENVGLLGLNLPVPIKSNCREAKDCNNNNNKCSEVNTFTLFSEKDMTGILSRVLKSDCRSTFAVGPSSVTSTGWKKVKKCLDDFASEDPSFVQSILKRIKCAKMNSLGPEDFETKDAEFSIVFRQFNRAMKAERALSFIDVVTHAIMVLINVPSVLRKVQQRYPFVLCDEFQDTSALQFSLLTVLSEKHGQITVIGDDDQLIYEFSGADKRNFDRFLSVFDRFRPIVVRLEQNYRSTGNIVAASSALIRHNIDRQTKNSFVGDATPVGAPIAIISCRTREIEYAYVSNAIRKLINDGCKPQNIAVIYRKKKHGGPLSDLFRQNYIPMSGSSGDRFLNMSKVKGIIALMKATAYQIRPYNLPQIVSVLGLKTISHSTICTLCNIVEVLDSRVVSTVAVLKRYALAVGDSLPSKEKRALLVLARTLEKLQLRVQELKLEEFVVNAVELLPFSEKSSMERFKKALSGMAYNYATAFEMAHPYGSSDKRLQRLIGFLDHIELHIRSTPIYVKETNRKKKLGKTYVRNPPEKRPEGVWMGTVHQAKGLEWDYVFVLQMNEGEFPIHALSKTSNYGHCDAGTLSSHMEAERRLAFVAASRARLQLTFTLSMVATAHMGVELEPSRFLKTIPKHIIKNLMYLDVSEFSWREGTDLQRDVGSAGSCLRENQHLWRSFWANPIVRERHSNSDDESRIRTKKRGNQVLMRDFPSDNGADNQRCKSSHLKNTRQKSGTEKVIYKHVDNHEMGEGEVLSHTEAERDYTPPVLSSSHSPLSANFDKNQLRIKGKRRKRRRSKKCFYSQ